MRALAMARVILNDAKRNEEPTNQKRGAKIEKRII